MELVAKQTPQEWIDKGVDFEALKKNVVNSLVEVINNGWDNGEGGYEAWVTDIVDGHHGVYIPLLALEYFGYDIDSSNLDAYMGDDYTESVHYELENFTNKLADLINAELSLNARVVFGYNDSDGSYSLMAYMDKDIYEKHGIGDY